MLTLVSVLLTGMSLGQTPQPIQPFPDVPRTHWAYAAVTELHQRGILHGYPSQYDRSTPHAALFSLLKAINNDDMAMIQKLTTSQVLENWMARLEVSSKDSHQRMAALKTESVIWKRWANFPPDALQEYTWEEFNSKAKQLPLGTEIEYHRWEKRNVIFRFVQDPSGWKVISISGEH